MGCIRFHWRAPAVAAAAILMYATSSMQSCRPGYLFSFSSLIRGWRSKLVRCSVYAEWLSRYVERMLCYALTQEAQLPQSNRATCYVSEFMLCFTSYWQWCHSIGHIRFPISLSLQLCLYLAPFPRYYYLFPKIERSHVTPNIAQNFWHSAPRGFSALSWAYCRNSVTGRLSN